MEKYQMTKSKKPRKFLSKVRQFFRRLGMAIADLIYWAYRHDKGKIPLPLLKFIIKQHGGWAGVSIYMNMREHKYDQRLTKTGKILMYVLLLVIMVVAIIIGLTQNSERFLFGFLQNLISEIILLLLVLYLLPKVLNKPNKYKVVLSTRFHYIPDLEKNRKTIKLILKNEGEEVYKSNEIEWEIFLPEISFEEIEIIDFIGNHEKAGFIIGHACWLYGCINSPLFIDQTIEIATICFKSESSQNEKEPPKKIYYILRTIGGNVPIFENVTQDFFGSGIPLDQYPKYGELEIN